MTDIVAAKEAIVQAFVTVWGSTTDLTLDNEEFSPSGSDPFVRLAVRHEDSAQETLGRAGNRRFARLGRVFVQVFVPVDEGTRQADTLAKQAREVFEGVSLAGTTVRFYNCVVREVGPDGKWYQVNVEAEFEYDETR